MRRTWRLVAAVIAVSACLGSVDAAPASASGTWIWPVSGPITRAFDPPGSPYGSGHRGIDIAVPFGTVIVAPNSGTVTFAGKVGGTLFLSIGHGGGIASTYSWVSALVVHKGDAVTSGEPVARTGAGHPGDLIPSLHLGVKLNGAYVDPLEYLAPADLGALIRLAPFPTA
jgi:murein DD-endopeptidase MepM/ murein hydrolase activator NlpD